MDLKIVRRKGGEKEGPGPGLGFTFQTYKVDVTRTEGRNGRGGRLWGNRGWSGY